MTEQPIPTAPDRFECRLFYKHATRIDNHTGLPVVDMVIHPDVVPAEGRFIFGTVYENEQYHDPWGETYWQALIDTNSEDEAIAVCALLNDMHGSVEDIYHRAMPERIKDLELQIETLKCQTTWYAENYGTKPPPDIATRLLPLNTYTVVLTYPESMTDGKRQTYTQVVQTRGRDAAVSAAHSGYRMDCPDAPVSMTDWEQIDVMRGAVEFVEPGVLS